MKQASVLIMTWMMLLLVLPLFAEDASDKEKPVEEEALTSKDYLDIAEKLRPSLVVVEYTLKYDKSEAPYGSGRGSFQFRRGRYGELVKQERPLEIDGLLLSDTEVISSDMMIHPRFIKSINVRVGEKLIPASFSRYSMNQNAVILKLATAVRNAKPLDFSAETEAPYLLAIFGRFNTLWTARVQSLPTNAVDSGKDHQFLSVSTHCLIVDEQGAAAGMSMNNKLPIDDSWKGSPLKWPSVSHQDLEGIFANLKKTVDEGIFRVTVHFRSPKKKNVLSRYGQFGSGDGTETEKEVIGLLVEKDTILLLADLNPKVTARLERIDVNLSDGRKVPAKFTHTLKDYGGIVARLDEPLGETIELCDQKDITPYQNVLLPSVEVRIRGEKRVSYFQHSRIWGFSLGWRKQIYPIIRGRANRQFIFQNDGSLLVLPVTQRAKPGQNQQAPKPTSAYYIKQVLAKLDDENVDASNVPLSEEEENRLAWIGMELQPLNKELARVNQVSDLTENGQNGALVSYIYPGSPAADAGIKPGYILLRLHVQDQPRPIEVQLGGYDHMRGPFPWNRLGETPEQYFDQIPRPWPSAENQFTRMLTDLGFGKKFTADFFFDGKVIKKEFVVTQSPRHYDTAARCKSKELGMTVRNMTYELRRYFRKEKGDPGVIVSKIEPGSKASVAGMKPYEIITHINDKPVMNVEDFEKLIAIGGELRLSVKRWTRGRVVKIKIDIKEKDNAPKPTTQPATQPTTQPATQPTTKPKPVRPKPVE